MNRVSDYIELLSKKGLLLKTDVSEDVANIEIDCLTYDNREVCGSALFVCKGAHFKAEYLHSSMANGAVAYVSEQVYEGVASYILVSDVRVAMVYLAELFYDNAPSKVKSIGITGTKGKSTTAFYLKAIMDSWLAAEGKPESAIISSITTYDGVINEKSHLTTPEAIPLHRSFNNAYESGITHLVMEVSSQALKYDRVLGLNFDVACFTNIGLDHISPVEHADFEDYFTSKLKIFDSCKVACINTDAQHSDRVLEYAEGKCEIVTFGSSADNTVCCSNIEKRGNATYFTVKTPEFSEEVCITMPGIFNVSNALAAIAMSYVLGIPKEYVISSLRDARVNGRMLVYNSSDDKIAVIVDYAHNKMSFDAIFNSVSFEYPDRAVIAVFGCPGNKAISRRKDMGESAGAHADYIILTEDDPAEEEIADINAEVVKYIGDCKYDMVENRGEAIHKAFFDYEADKRVILILGKGEETTQKRGTEFVPTPSDSEYTMMCLKEYEMRNEN